MFVPPEASDIVDSLNFGGINRPHNFPDDVLYPFLLVDRHWYWFFNPNADSGLSPGPPITIGDGTSDPGIAFRQEFIAWSDWFGGIGAKFNVPFQLSTIPDLSPPQISASGYGWGEFVLPADGSEVKLYIAPAQFQAFAITFYGGSSQAKIHFQLSNELDGVNPICGSFQQLGQTLQKPPLDPYESGGFISVVFPIRMFRGQKQPLPVHIRMYVSETDLPAKVFAMGRLGHLIF